MQDKFLMEQLLNGSKVITDLYLHGYIESSNEDVQNTFLKALNEALELHTKTYTAMKNENFYTISNVEKSKIQKTQNKLEKSVKTCLKEE